MRRNTIRQKASAEKVVKDIRRATRRHYGAEDEDPDCFWKGCAARTASPNCVAVRGSTRTSITVWSKDFLEAGKKRLAGDTAREATSDEVKQLRSEPLALKEAVADLTLDNRLLKKSMIADGDDEA